MMKKFERKTVFIYEINGQEKIKVTSAEEAEHWDAVFEVAEQVDQVLLDTPPDIKLDEAQRTELSLYLAQHRSELMAVLSGTEEEAVESKDAPEPKQKDAEPSKAEKGSQMKKQSFVQEFKRPVEPSKDGFSL
ncbi:MAG: YebG family protein [Halopseudomonas sp.]